MIVISCIDDNGGVLFNSRRQSKDRMLNNKVLNLVGSDKLWMSRYTSQLFEEMPNDSINIDDNFLTEAADNDFCFVEGQSLKPYKQWIKKIILFKWNRSYPYDTSFDIPVQNGEWKFTYSEEFEGSSHEKITMEVYER